MIKRFIWLIIGFVLGAASSWELTRRLRKVTRRYVPAEVRDRWSGSMRAAVNEGRDAMRDREAELKAGYGRVNGK